VAYLGGLAVAKIFVIVCESNYDVVRSLIAKITESIGRCDVVCSSKGLCLQTTLTLLLFLLPNTFSSPSGILISQHVIAFVCLEYPYPLKILLKLTAVQ
jgi:hypothetical protein